MVEIDPPEGLGVLGGGLVIVGGFLPWITWISGSVNGLDRNGGLTVLLGAAAVGVALLVTLDRRGGFVLSGLGLLTLVLGGRTFLDMRDAISRIDQVAGLGDLAQVEPGIGLYLTVAGGAIVLIGGALGVRGAMEDSAS